jgi:hypothetical protein
VRRDGPRGDLRAVGEKLAPGSGDPLENDYLETAVIADLTFPRDRDRVGCAQQAGRRKASLRVAPRRVRAGQRVRLRFRTGRRLRGGRVWLRGRGYKVSRRGRAVARVKLRRGRHVATLTKPGYRRPRVKFRVVR